jgi:hypothetical protein
MRNALPEGMFAAGIYGTNVGGFVGLRECEVTGIEVLSSLESMARLA